MPLYMTEEKRWNTTLTLAYKRWCKCYDITENYFIDLEI